MDNQPKNNCMFYIKNIDIVKVPPLNLNPGTATGIEFLNKRTDCTVYHDSMEITMLDASTQILLFMYNEFRSYIYNSLSLSIYTISQSKRTTKVVPENSNSKITDTRETSKP